MTAAQLPGHAPGWKWRKEHAGQVERPWAWSQINGGEDVPAHVGGLCESGWHIDCPQAPLQQPAGAGQCSCPCHYTREDRPMTYLPTPEQFLAEPSTDEDDFEEVALDPLTSIAASLERIASSYTVGERVSSEYVGETCSTCAEVEERRQRLNEEYDDLEDKHRALYELLADVEKIVAKSTSKVSLEVKAAINAWRNPEVPVEPDPEAARCAVCAEAFPDVIALQAHGTRAHGADFDYRDPAPEPDPTPEGYKPEELKQLTGGDAIPAADADLAVWREYARGRGVENADQLNRSQIRTALGLPHFDAVGA